MNVENPTHVAYLVGGVLAVMVTWPLVSMGVEAVSLKWRLRSATKSMPLRVRDRWREILSPDPSPEVHAAWTRLGIRTGNRAPTVVVALHRRRRRRWKHPGQRYTTCGLIVRPALATATAWESRAVRRELAAALGVQKVWTQIIGNPLPADAPWWMQPEHADSREARHFRLRHSVAIPPWPSLTPKPGDVLIRWDIPERFLE